jgi:hypothetical protein
VVHSQEPKRLREHSDDGSVCGESGSRALVSKVWKASIFASGDGGAVSTVIENLLVRKQKLVEELEKAQAVEDRDRIEHQLEQINTALDFLDRPGSKDGR